MDVSVVDSFLREHTFVEVQDFLVYTILYFIFPIIVIS